MLCATCLFIFEKNPVETTVIEGPHQANIENLRRAAKQGCYLCSDLVLEYDDIYHDDVNCEANGSSEFLTFELRMSVASNRIGLLSFQFVKADLSSATYELVYTGTLVKPPAYDEFLQLSRADVSNEAWRVRDDSFPSSSAMVPKSTGDLATLKIAAQWLRNCLESHSSCEDREFTSAAPWFPKRLLDLSSEGRIRLIETRQQRPKERYATLSHCWGPKPICTLTTDNIEEFKEDVPDAILSNTFRDAVAVTRMLEIRYLWIDSLCIIQAGDAGKDWIEHATAMRKVYSNTLLNIAAANAEEGADGIFNERDKTLLRPSHIQWKWSANFHNYGSDAFWTIRAPHHHSATRLRVLPLYMRGWVVQERFLAPRVLHFAEDRVIWECTGLPFAEESFPTGFQNTCPEYQPINNWPFNGTFQYIKGSDDPYSSAIDNMHELWQDVVTGYTNGDLSFPEKDVFIALAGIAEKFGQGFDWQYVAGLFRQHLPFDLMWQNKGKVADGYRAPSWSWASIDGSVEMKAFSDCPLCDRCTTRQVDVEDAKVKLVDEKNVYGQVKSAELVLRGYLLQCDVKPISEAGTGLKQKMRVYLKPNVKASTVQAAADIDDDKNALLGYDSESQRSAWVLPITEMKAGANHFFQHYGLIVEEALNGRFRRVGIYLLQSLIMHRIQGAGLYEKRKIVLI